MTACTFIMAEDDEDDRFLAQEAFDIVDPEMNVSMVVDGADLIKKLRSEPDSKPQLVLLDLNMPRTDGFAVLDIVRQDETLKSLPIVVLTTTSDLGDRQRCIQAGADDFITKPGSFDNLVAIIRDLVEKYCNPSECLH